MRLKQSRRQSAVAARKHSLDPTHARIMPRIADLTVGYRLPQPMLFFLEHLNSILRLPLERGKRLRNKAGYAYRDLRALSALYIRV